MAQSVLFGIHDREGRHIVPPGGWVVDVVALSENPQPTDYALLRPDVNWIVRLSWGYGTTGTIPLPHEYANFAARCADYVARSKGVHAWIIGNEPNHKQERPNGVYITPAMYAECFVKCRKAIKLVDPNAQVIPAPCAPYHANPIPWTEYWHEMLTLIAANGGCDGLALHTYTRSSSPADITSDAAMGPPLMGTRSGFLTYRDALQLVPQAMSGLPVYITEFNELLPEGWHDTNTGVVQAAYAEIDWWNKQDVFPIMCLCLYRWPKYDKWHIDGKPGVIDDFKAAIGRGYTSPVHGKTNVQTPTTSQPTPSAATPDLPARDWDARLTQRGVTVETPHVAPGQQFWRVVRARWFDEGESGGRHHIYVEAPAGTPFRVTWPSGSAPGYANGRSGFDAGNFNMSPSRNEFSVQIRGDMDIPSEIVRGIGMGAETPGGFNAGIHTSTLVTFQLVTMPQQQSKPIETQLPYVPNDGPQPAPAMPELTHPVSDAQYRQVTQRFGVNGDYYKRFAVDGVPLKGHNGIDYATPIGAWIVAVDSGRVVEVADDPTGYGKYVKIAHSWGESLYAHLADQLVRVGESINRGELLGNSGNTGNSTGPHLHFGLRVAPFDRRDGWGGFTDPAPYLPHGTPRPLPQVTPASLVTLIKAAAQEFGVEWQLLASLAWAESSWNPNATSAAGAMGMCQIMGPTWREWSAKIGAGPDAYDARQNLRVGAAYLAWLGQQVKGDTYRALHAFVFGIGNVTKGVPIPEEAYDYADRVVHGRDLLKAVGA